MTYRRITLLPAAHLHDGDDIPTYQALLQKLAGKRASRMRRPKTVKHHPPELRLSNLGTASVS